MKKTVPLLTLAICAIAAVSYSSLIYTETILNDGDNGAGNTVAANSTNSTSTMIPVLVSSSTCTIQVRHRLVASSTALVTYTIQKNDQKDSTNWVSRIVWRHVGWDCGGVGQNQYHHWGLWIYPSHFHQ